MFNGVSAWDGSSDAWRVVVTSHAHRVEQKQALTEQVMALLDNFSEKKGLLNKVIKVLDNDKLRACNSKFAITHPLEVALLFAEYFPDYTSHEIIAAVCHDLAEDQKLNPQQLLDLVEEHDIAKSIWGVTKREGQPHEEYRNVIRTASEEGCYSTATIKAVDTLHNSRNLGSFRPDKQLRKASEYLENAQMFKEIASLWGDEHPRHIALLRISEEIAQNCLQVLNVN